MSRQEKGKSLFEKVGISVGSSKRKNSSKHNGTATRPISTNEGEVIDDLEIDNRIKRMSVEEVNKTYRNLLDDMNIPKDKQEPLLQKSIDDKRKMLKINMKKEIGN